MVSMGLCWEGWGASPRGVNLHAAHRKARHEVDNLVEPEDESSPAIKVGP